jgi:cysteinyl-tRNA synthetase
LFFCLYEEKINIKKKETQKTGEVVKALLSNLNTIKVLYYLEEIIKFLNKSIGESKRAKEFGETVNNFYFILDILGFKFDLPNYNSAVKLLIKKWQKFREKKQYSEADKIRERLQKMDII